MQRLSDTAPGRVRWPAFVRRRWWALVSRRSDVVHRWRRPMLHVAACALVAASGVVGAAQARHGLPMTRTDLSAIITSAEDDADLPASVAAPVPALLVLPEPTVTVLDAPPTNPAAPREPDAQLAVRSYLVEEGDSVRT